LIKSACRPDRAQPVAPNAADGLLCTLKLRQLGFDASVGATMTKAVEFGLIHETTRAGDSVRHAILAEKLGFSSYWVPEDYAFPGAFSICSAIACQTKRIKIGIGVLNP